MYRQFAKIFEAFKMPEPEKTPAEQEQRDAEEKEKAEQQKREEDLKKVPKPVEDDEDMDQVIFYSFILKTAYTFTFS